MTYWLATIYFMAGIGSHGGPALSQSVHPTELGCALAVQAAYDLRFAGMNAVKPAYMGEFRSSCTKIEVP